MKPTALRNQGAWFAALVIGVVGACSLTTCAPSITALDKVRQTGVLRVATVNSPTTYYMGPDGPAGFEYDLASGLAKRLGVELKIEVANSPPAALDLVKSGQVDLAAASLAVTSLRGQSVRFSQPVLSVVPQLVYRMGASPPKSIEDVHGKLVVPADSSHAERLTELRAKLPQLAWQESDDEDSEDLLEKVVQGEIDYTIAYSDIVAINQRYYPKLRVAFPLAASQDLAWALSLDRDDSLFKAVDGYLASIRDTELARLRDRHFGHIEQVDYLGAVALATHVQTRLPRYRESFQKAGRRYGLDWRLIAAIAYQESRWDSAAISPTGVRGIMQLTSLTALHLKVDDREDPLQSISGGARYLRNILDELPADIAEPDRTWLALSAYNMGMGHLQDVRDLTRRAGGDSTRWLDVRNSLPLLGQPKWYKNTRHGYARGRQAMVYVGNVRTYFDMLVWLTDSTNNGQQLAQNSERKTVNVDEHAVPENLPVAAPVVEARDAGQVLKIRSPIL